MKKRLLLLMLVLSLIVIGAINFNTGEGYFVEEYGGVGVGRLESVYFGSNAYEIPIISAEHLDLNREFISDIYDAQGNNENYSAESFRKIEILYFEKIGGREVEDERPIGVDIMFFDYIGRYAFIIVLVLAGLVLFVLLILLLFIVFIKIHDGLLNVRKKLPVVKEKLSGAKKKFITIKGGLSGVNERLKSLKEYRRSGGVSDSEYGMKKRLLMGLKGDVLRGKIYSYVLVMVFVGLVLLLGGGITGSVVGFSNRYFLSAFMFVFIVFVFGLFIYGHRFWRGVKRKNSIRDLVGREVYSEDGEYIGRVKDVILEDCKIHSLRIKVKNVRVRRGVVKKGKGIIIRYYLVRNVGDIVLIDERVEEFL